MERDRKLPRVRDDGEAVSSPTTTVKEGTKEEVEIAKDIKERPQVGSVGGVRYVSVHTIKKKEKCSRAPQSQDEHGRHIN